MTNKEIQKEIKQWLKDWKQFEPKQQDFYDELEQFGLLTAKGNVRYAKSVSKDLEKFYNTRVKDNDYASFESKKREQYEALNDNSISFSDFMYQEYSYSELITELFNRFDSEIAYEEKSYLDMLSRNEAIERLEEEISNGEIASGLEKYMDTYGDFEPPF